jgi:metallophosphoesterase (TIGR00282 family)
MKILFLGDVVGASGRSVILKTLLLEIKNKKIDFVVVNGENAADSGVGITEEICRDFFNCGVEKEKRLLRPENLFEPSPGKGFRIFEAKNGMRVGVLNLMGNVFMKKCDDVFETAERFLKRHKLKEHYDFLVVDFHGEITSEKMAMGHFFDGNASLFVGTHTHVPTNDSRILKGGTAYQTDAGMCGDYNSVIGMDKDNSINRFFKKKSSKHFPATGEATLCGVIVDCCKQTGLAKNIENFIYGGELKDSY